MKLVIAIVHQEDEHGLMKELTKYEFGVTKLASTGGFLKTGNTTLLIGVEKAKVDGVIKIIKDTCECRKDFTTTSPVMGAGRLIGSPIEVTVGGATVFVVDVENYFKL